MRSLIADKIASVTANCQLRADLRVTDEFPCRSGDVIAVRILNDKTKYNVIELVTGRMSAAKRGDVVVGALGHRKASQGFAGHVPEALAIGDKINLLNLGGVIGVCTSASPLVGEPFEVEVLGQVQSFPIVGSRVAHPANIADGLPPLDKEYAQSSVPVIAVVGTSMNSGKTEACIRVITQLARQGLKVAAGKATGVSLMRDLLGMNDAGARETLSFNQLGVVTTSRTNAVGVTKTIVNRLSQTGPDVIVLELGDGLLGDYGVDRILAEKGFRDRVSAVILAANDTVGAWGGVEILRSKYELPVTAVTGPATDNEAGVRSIEMRMEAAAINARTEPERLVNEVLSKLGAAVG